MVQLIPQEVWYFLKELDKGGTVLPNYFTSRSVENTHPCKNLFMNDNIIGHNTQKVET